jgi:hypothetical protein
VTNLFNTSIECPASTAIPISPSASVSLDVGADVHVTVGLSASASGTLVPPNIAEFGLSFGTFILCDGLGLPTTKIDNVDNFCVALDGNVDANISVVANVSGKVSSGSITLFQIGIPGLSFPGYVVACPMHWRAPNKGKDY